MVKGDLNLTQETVDALKFSISHLTKGEMQDMLLLFAITELSSFGRGDLLDNAIQYVGFVRGTIAEATKRKLNQVKGK